MFEHLVLTRPLAIFDLETTGISPERDRIVEISVVKGLPGGGVETKTRRVNPGIPIPKAATAVHGIIPDHILQVLALVLAESEPGFPTHTFKMTRHIHLVGKAHRFVQRLNPLGQMGIPPRRF